MRRILFLMSDTGGGHRAACNAVIAQFEATHSGEFSAELVDLWRDYTPWPWNTMPKTYGRWVNAHPASYEAQYWLNDRIMQNPNVSRAYERFQYARLQHLYRDHPSDLVVCAHSVFVRPALYARERLGLKLPFVTLITDYALPTVLWYDARATKTLVPIEPALQRGLDLGLPAEKLFLTGPVIHPKFAQAKRSKPETRVNLGWDLNAKIVVLVGGGDGMGLLLATARAIDAGRADCQLVVLTGKNASLKAQLEAQAWRKPVRVYGFTDQVHVMLAAADVLISKAGPATLAEAAVMGVPVIVNGAIKHQESPNAEFVVAQGAGVYAPSPQTVVFELERVLGTSGELERLGRTIQKLAVPDATERIAREIWSSF